jgi:hypothetical protein
MSSDPRALEYVDFQRGSAFIVGQGRIAMKTMRLCFLLFLFVGLASVSYAQHARANSSKADSSNAKSSEAEYPTSHFADGVTGRLLVNVKPGDLDWLNRSNTQECAYMRTYRVKRQARGSDSMVPAGYTTCVPMARFETRSAVETITDSGDGK